MEFPEAQPIGRRERSIAERHRLFVLLWSVLSLLPAGLVISRVVTDPRSLLLLTFVLAYASTWVVARLLRGRFLAMTTGQELTLRPTLRAPARETSVAVQTLSTRGFAIVETTVVVTISGVVLTRPMVVLRRHGDGQVVAATSHGSTMITVLDDGTWLVTASMGVVSHPLLRIEQVANRDMTALIACHDRRLMNLSAEGIAAGKQPPALELVLGIEHMEQETVSALRSSRMGAPSARVLRRVGN